MTVFEAAYEILGEQTFDCALPQSWVDHVAATTGRAWGDVGRQFVWAYDTLAGFSGRPCALTADANEILAAYNTLTGASYPLTENPPA